MTVVLDKQRVLSPDFVFFLWLLALPDSTRRSCCHSSNPLQRALPGAWYPDPESPDQHHLLCLGDLYTSSSHLWSQVEKHLWKYYSFKAAFISDWRMWCISIGYGMSSTLWMRISSYICWKGNTQCKQNPQEKYLLVWMDFCGLDHIFVLPYIKEFQGRYMILCSLFVRTMICEVS